MTNTDRLTTALAGRYRIERELGQGGMATVYLAHDVKHDRQVAVKVLRPELAAVLGADRFVQEIKTTAALQHPHILPLFDSGQAYVPPLRTAERESGGEAFLFYVMPYVEGENLRDKLNRETQLGIDEAVRIATEVADALDYAHRHGVIHRDIKPENILLHDGRPMVADFGIALAVSAAAGGRMTETGMSLGTPHYMSPEQATAEKEITARSDVYSLASVLYEMLTGEPPHMGNSAHAIIMKIVTEDAQPVTRLRKSVPPNVAAAVAKGLEKLPADRFETAQAFAEALKNPAFAMGTVSTASPVAAAVPPYRRTAVVTIAAVAVVAIALAALGWLRPDPQPTVARYGIAFPEGQDLLDGVQPSFALAPDGSWIVYDGPAESGSQLWVKRRDALAAVPLPGTRHGGGSAPAVSPDGEWIMFTVDGQLRKVPRGGGSAITVADSVNMNTRSVAWLDDGTIVYRDVENRLRRVSDAGGYAEIAWTPPETGDLRPILPTPLPESPGVLFTACYDAGCNPLELWVLDFRSGEARRLVTDVARGWYVATGHLMYVRPDGGVFAAPFDPGSLATTGPAVPVLEGVQVGGGRVPDLALSRTGSLLMLAGASGRANSEAVWVDRDGSVTPVDPDWRFGLAGNYGWSLSPDGGWLAIALFGQDGNDVWVKELDRGPVSRLTTDPGGDIRPRWTPDGRTVAFMDGNLDLWVRRADGTLPPQGLVDLEESIFEALWSRDGRWLVLRTGAEGGRDIWAQQLEADSAPRRLLASDFDERAVTLSPDGRWLAYQSDESGQDEVYVRPFPDISNGKWTVSLDGGSRPLWSHGGNELFYVDGDDRHLVAAQVRTAPSLEVIGRQVLFPVDQYALSANYTPFDVSPDDRRFLMVRTASEGEDGAAPMLVLAEHWFEELKAKVRR